MEGACTGRPSLCSGRRQYTEMDARKHPPKGGTLGRRTLALTTSTTARRNHTPPQGRRGPRGGLGQPAKLCVFDQRKSCRSNCNVSTGVCQKSCRSNCWAHNDEETINCVHRRLLEKAAEVTVGRTMMKKLSTVSTGVCQNSCRRNCWVYHDEETSNCVHRRLPTEKLQK